MGCAVYQFAWNHCLSNTGSSSVVNLITHLDQLEKGVELNLRPGLYNVPKESYSLRVLQWQSAFFCKSF